MLTGWRRRGELEYCWGCGKRWWNLMEDEMWVNFEAAPAKVWYGHVRLGKVGR